MAKETTQPVAHAHRTRCVKWLTVLAVGVVAVLVGWAILMTRLGAWRAPLTPADWQALMASHPYERDPSYARSPCPMINTLANHGFLPRDGREVALDQMFEAMTMMGVPPLVLYLFLQSVFVTFHQVVPTDPFLDGFKPAKTIDLNQLTIHNLIEHDVSLTRRDIHLPPHDVTHPDKNLVERMVRMALHTNSSFFGLQQEHDYRRVRWLESARENPLNMLGISFQFSSAVECSLLLDIIGRDGALRADHLESILLHERFPEDWHPRPKTQPVHDVFRSIYRCWSGLRKSTATPETLESLMAPLPET